MAEHMTICAKCKHHRGRGDIWYNQYCAHPDLQNPVMIDPVSGKKGYAKKNTLGRTYYDEVSTPYCRDVNDGECSRFKGRMFAHA